jgi:hypothetical protein
MKCSIPLSLAGAALVLAARASSAQFISSVAVDATTGAGKGRGGTYWDRDNGGVRLAVSLRHRTSPNVSLYSELAMEWLAIRIGHDALCVLKPDGSCMPAYPEFSGPAATFGLVAQPNQRLEFRGAVGGAAYKADGTRVGAIVGQLDGVVFPFQHVGFLIGGRVVTVPRYRGDQLATYPWMVGVRFH